MAYTTLAVVRAMEGMEDATAWPDATITESIAWSTQLIDWYTGTSWEAKAFDITISGSGTGSIRLIDPTTGRRVLFPVTVSSSTVDAVGQTVSSWALFPEGIIVRDSGTFTYTHPGNNVNLVGTAGATTTIPDDLAFCARTISRQYCLDLISRVDDRAVMMTNDFGTIRLSQPGRLYPTGMPAVDAILNRRKQRGPVVA